MARRQFLFLHVRPRPPRRTQPALRPQGHPEHVVNEIRRHRHAQQHPPQPERVMADEQDDQHQHGVDLEMLPIDQRVEQIGLDHVDHDDQHDDRQRGHQPAGVDRHQDDRRRRDEHPQHRDEAADEDDQREHRQRRDAQQEQADERQRGVGHGDHRLGLDRAADDKGEAHDRLRGLFVKIVQLRVAQVADLLAQPRDVERDQEAEEERQQQRDRGAVELDRQPGQLVAQAVAHRAEEFAHQHVAADLLALRDGQVVLAQLGRVAGTQRAAFGQVAQPPRHRQRGPDDDAGRAAVVVLDHQRRRRGQRVGRLQVAFDPRELILFETRRDIAHQDRIERRILADQRVLQLEQPLLGLAQVADQAVGLGDDARRDEDDEQDHRQQDEGEDRGDGHAPREAEARRQQARQRQGDERQDERHEDQPEIAAQQPEQAEQDDPDQRAPVEAVKLVEAERHRNRPCAESARSARGRRRLVYSRLGRRNGRKTRGPAPAPGEIAPRAGRSPRPLRRGIEVDFPPRQS
ncbi:MAG: hypothetical protein BWZ08_02523 [candidate division BRC1 bacterium ADurb.BinA292]|nr:MAG: hypothetical protein BWZ08_02523 [candidate division BRC1 bacterium ADurb.BinA292]